MSVQASKPGSKQLTEDNQLSGNMIDGITGPSGECTCSHCQMNNNIDSLTIKTEDNDDQAMVPVYQQASA